MHLLAFACGARSLASFRAGGRERAPQAKAVSARADVFTLWALPSLSRSERRQRHFGYWLKNKAFLPTASFREALASSP
jgi:hypothetical protein